MLFFFIYIFVEIQLSKYFTIKIVGYQIYQSKLVCDLKKIAKYDNICEKVAVKLLLGGNFMCGIVGYIGSSNAIDIILNGLETLEYRGYHSSGIEFLDNKKIDVI